MAYLAEYDLIGLLEKGDGGHMHPIKMSWGKQLKQKKPSEDETLTRSVIKMIEFLFKQVLSQVILLDSKGGDEGQDTINQTSSGDQVSFQATQALFN